MLVQRLAPGAFAPIPTLPARRRRSLSATTRSRTPICSARPRSIAPSIRDANPVILGAGPVGCVLALLLQKHNIPVTLIDITPRHLSIQSSRSYSFGINNRGQQALSHLPRLLEKVQSIGARSFPMKRHFRQSDGSWKITTLGSLGAGKKATYSLSRHLFVSLCRDEIDAASSITSLYETSLDAIDTLADGQLQLHLESLDGHLITVNTSLLLACDGVRSRCAQLLQHLPLKSSAGLERRSVRTYAQRYQAKILLLNHDFYKSEQNNHIDDEQYAPGDHMMYTFHKIYPNKMEDSLLLDVFPQSYEVMKQQGGVRAAVRAHPSHIIWRLNDPNAAIDLFEKELPLLRPREAINRDSLSTFLSVEPLNLPSVARRASLSATTLKGKNPSGIVFLGDAAHSFPPDVGEGLNAGLQDALLFVNTLVEGGIDDTPSELAGRYERLREPETSALMRFAQRSVIAAVPSRWDAFNMGLRSILAKRFPGVYYPPAVFLRSTFNSYEEIMRRADETTMRLYVVSVFLLVVVCATIAVLVVSI
ncbi:Aromatic-ring hydroxylase (flavoprotein monooxygenase) [Gracilaria domingensis]|nr:Aromatic-ring hydroxylase (flavoprotein monooxygenase) [Gracilaria domingensis]